jgi:A/G-specific adenine glycosylase
MHDGDELSERLVSWYRKGNRRLPWRDEPTPWNVLLSELMLQQTRVETVLPYFARFKARWPTLEAFAAADEEEVLKEWAGLGYYSRARNLLKAARAAVEAGGIPGDADGLRSLPGVGPYTAGAVASIAFGRAEPAVDGNVERVLSRVDAREADPKSPSGRASLEARARELLRRQPPGDVNQALMELGATVCTPRSPSCPRCPWADVCEGRAKGIAETLPRKKPKPPPRPAWAVAGLLRREGRLLMGRRPEGLLGGLWEPVGAVWSGASDPGEAVRQAFRERAGLEVRVRADLGEVVHVFTHRRLSLRVFAVEGPGEPALGEGYDAIGWVDPARPHVGLSKLALKALALGTPTLFS